MLTIYFNLKNSILCNIKTRVRELETKFRKANSIIAQLARYIQNDDFSMDVSAYAISASFNEVISKYLPGAVYCGVWSKWKNIKGCYNSHDKNLKPFHLSSLIIPSDL